MYKRIGTASIISMIIIFIYILIITTYNLNRLGFILLTASAALTIILTIFYHIYAFKVIQASPFIKEWNGLNTYTMSLFHPQSDMKLEYAYDRKSQLDGASTKSFLENDMYNNIESYCEMNKKYLHNVSVVQTYESEQLTMKNKYKVEKHTLKSHVIARHASQTKLNLLTNQKIVVKLTYTSPQGRNHYVKKDNYMFALLDDMIKTITLLINHHASEAYKKRIERSKMSSRLRFIIFKRDHYTCRICGQSKHDKVKLHVDHIIPIAKGGKTIEENLQTLCETCNAGKSDLNMYAPK